MWRTLTACLALILLVCPASARHRHHHRHQTALSGAPTAAQASRDRQTEHPLEQNRSISIPPGWTASESKKGDRFVSPEGRAWFEVYSSDVGKEPIPAQMRSIAFGEGETLTLIRGESDRIEVAGIKGDRKFYRKAIIACAGQVWHQLEFEYPVDMSRHIEPLLKSASDAVDASENVGCDKRAPAASDPSATTMGSAPAR